MTTGEKPCAEAGGAEQSAKFDPQKEVAIQLFGCCSYEGTWEPGIEGWGKSDKESREGGYVSVGDYDELSAYAASLRAELAAQVELTRTYIQRSEEYREQLAQERIKVLEG